ncbi:hypothetical protein P4C99_06470, partial [Pontiellaceae bacterium B1224]|nr:hypothetical protein [Pontiellaceae bacterium B1224]
MLGTKGCGARSRLEASGTLAYRPLPAGSGARMRGSSGRGDKPLGGLVHGKVSQQLGAIPYIAHPLAK